MTTQTHILLGALIGASAAAISNCPPPQAFLLGLISVFGASMSDIPPVLTFIKDKLDKVPPFSREKEGSFGFYSKEFSHSPLFWIIGFFFFMSMDEGFPKLLVLIFSISFLSHWVTDVFTHVGPQFKVTDQSLIFPLYFFWDAGQPGTIPKLGQYLGKLGLGWEFREDYKAGDDLRTKPMEKKIWVLLIVATTVAGLIWLF